VNGETPASAKGIESSQIEIVTTTERPDLDGEANAAFRSVWPEFIFHDPVSREHMDRVETYFPYYNVMLLDHGEVVAGGWGVPFAWDGTVLGLPEGYDGALISSVGGHESGIKPNTLSVMAAAVRADRQGGGLAGQVLTALSLRAAASGLGHMLAPVRPTLKSRYPLTPMDEFATWARSDGLHIDPWVRTHQRLGATILASALRSMVITGTVAEWESWAEMAFPQSGRYVVPYALDLVEINCEVDRGVYVETNLWMQHQA
jgi:GNAT superfamily N-acetyltransferase